MSPSNKNIFVIQGCGALVGSAVGRATLWQKIIDGEQLAERHYTDFRDADQYVDRKFLRVLTARDTFAMSALKLMQIDAGDKLKAVHPERLGFYVGAGAASVASHTPYIEAIRSSTDATGQASVANFGVTSMNARPITLLMGLPNNVLAYGAMMLDARGPNSNYISHWASGYSALIATLRRLERGQIDLGIAGAYALHSQEIEKAAFLQTLDTLEGSDQFSQRSADAAAFVTLARHSLEEPLAPGQLAIVAGGMGNDALGPRAFDRSGKGLQDLLKRLLTGSGVSVSDIGLVMVGARGLNALDVTEREVLHRLFVDTPSMPAVASLSPVLGATLEAGVFLELSLAQKIHAHGSVPKSLRLQGLASDIGGGQPYVLLLGAAPTGEFGAVLLKVGV